MEREGAVVANLDLPLSAIFFDFDGTLFELKVAWLELRRELKELLDFSGPAEEFKPLRPRIQEITKGFPKREQQAYALISKHEIAGVAGGYPHRGAKELLEWLRDKGVKIVILTRNTKDCVLPVIKKYRWPKPDLIIARDDVQKEKPDPEAGLLALEKLRLQKDECLIVGDSLPDLELAKNLEIKSVLVFNPRHEFVPQGKADFFIRNLGELREIIN